MTTESRKAQKRIIDAKHRAKRKLAGEYPILFKVWVPEAEKPIYKEVIRKAIKDAVNELRGGGSS